MPQMTNEQRVGFLLHVFSLIFTKIRFPFNKQPGTQEFAQLVHDYQNRVQQIKTDIVWAPWVIGDQATARTFKCHEVGANILMGFDINLDLGLPNPYPIRVIEQNPFKRDYHGNLKQTAIMAQRGHQIAWVIRNDRTNQFLGKIQDGVFELSKPRAYTNKVITPLQGMGAGITRPDQRTDQYGVNHYNEGGEWISELNTIGKDDVLGIV